MISRVTRLLQPVFCCPHHRAMQSSAETDPLIRHLPAMRAVVSSDHPRACFKRSQDGSTAMCNVRNFFGLKTCIGRAERRHVPLWRTRRSLERAPAVG